MTVMGTQAAHSLASLLQLQDRVAVVTGGGAGIGRAICRRLAEAGAHVVVADFDPGRAEAAADEVTEAGGLATWRQIDVRQVGSLAALAAAVFAAQGRLDCWINNAGIYPPAPVFTASEEDFDRMMEINLRSVYFATREAARWMIEAGRGGVVVNIASIAAYRAGPPNLAHYAASKAGVVSLTKNLAWAFGGSGIRVVGIAPGVIATEGLEANQSNLRAIGANVWNRDERIGLKRLGTPDDIARVAVFLSSDLAEFVTGVTIPVDGGDVTLGPSDRPQLADLGYSE